MRVLIACEFSGTVRNAFRALGHDALSCDLLPSTAPGPHYTGDVRDVLGEGWDLMIAHPPCTYLCSSGLHWNKRRAIVDGRPRAELTEEALEFVRLLMDAPIPRIAIENPIGCISSRIRKPDQIIQPYHFGADASKSTCLWLKGLSKLQGTLYVQPRMVCPFCNGEQPYETAGRGCLHCRQGESGHLKPRWANQTNSGQNRLGPSEDRWAERSITYPGIAEAMAEQWGSRA